MVIGHAAELTSSQHSVAIDTSLHLCLLEQGKLRVHDYCHPHLARLLTDLHPPHHSPCHKAGHITSLRALGHFCPQIVLTTHSTPLQASSHLIIVSFTCALHNSHPSLLFHYIYTTRWSIKFHHLLAHRPRQPSSVCSHPTCSSSHSSLPPLLLNRAITILHRPPFTIRAQPVKMTSIDENAINVALLFKSQPVKGLLAVAVIRHDVLEALDAPLIVFHVEEVRSRRCTKIND